MGHPIKDHWAELLGAALFGAFTYGILTNDGCMSCAKDPVMIIKTESTPTPSPSYSETPDYGISTVSTIEPIHSQNSQIKESEPTPSTEERCGMSVKIKNNFCVYELPEAFGKDQYLWPHINDGTLVGYQDWCTKTPHGHIVSLEDLTNPIKGVYPAESKIPRLKQYQD